jgi:hypothetical protein
MIVAAADVSESQPTVRRQNAALNRTMSKFIDSITFLTGTGMLGRRLNLLQLTYAPEQIG